MSKFYVKFTRVVSPENVNISYERDFDCFIPDAADGMTALAIAQADDGSGIELVAEREIARAPAGDLGSSFYMLDNECNVQESDISDLETARLEVIARENP